MRNLIMILAMMAGLFSGMTVLADGNEDDPTPTAPSVGRRGATMNDNPVTEDGTCAFEWAFAAGDTEACPEGVPMEGEMVMQRFEYGYMIWVQPNDLIYVIHNTAESPRWFATPDPYVIGTPERDFSFNAEPQPPQTSQPRLGFGALWREDDATRARIGWAVQGWEAVYDGRLQRGTDGTIYIDEPGGGVFVLMPGAEDWKLYSTR
ncbi:MAG: hypothetical protein AAF787_14085 [Chloroflexota bacterium]